MVNKDIYIKNIITAVIISFFIFIFINEAYSIDLYGSPKDKIFAYTSGRSPLSGSPMTEVKEGYVNDGGRVVLDTLSKEEKNRLGIKDDNKMFVVIYQSPYTGESSFGPGEDNFGNRLERTLVELLYGYKRKYLSAEPFRDGCEPLSPVDEIANQKRDREHFRKFYQSHKALDLSDEVIEGLWEKYKRDNPDQFKY